MNTRPAVGCSSPARMRSAVVLPQPEGPSSARKLPSGTSRSRSIRAANAAEHLAHALVADVHQAGLATVAAWNRARSLGRDHRDGRRAAGRRRANTSSTAQPAHLAASLPHGRELEAVVRRRAVCRRTDNRDVLRHAPAAPLEPSMVRWHARRWGSRRRWRVHAGDRLEAAPAERPQRLAADVDLLLAEARVGERDAPVTQRERCSTTSSMASKSSRSTMPRRSSSGSSNEATSTGMSRSSRTRPGWPSLPSRPGR